MTMLRHDTLCPDLERPYAVFLDRDGVINRRIPDDYVRTWPDFQFLPGALEALAMLAGKAQYVVVVTNQQAVGKGLMTERALTEIHLRMVMEVQRHGGRIDDVLFCPHLACEQCSCRKPRPGMVSGWLDGHPDIASRNCLMVGDSLSDMELADAWPGGAVPGVLITDEVNGGAHVISPSLRDVALRLPTGRTTVSAHLS